MVLKGKHYRMIIFVIVYGPYKDMFDIFIDLFKKNWPDCPYPMVIANEYYPINEEHIITMDFKEGTSSKDRLHALMNEYVADYYLGFEVDRVIIDKVNTVEVEKVLDFMEKEKIQYFRCHASINKKKEKDRYEDYEHFFHIPASEPYGVCGSTAIWSRNLREELRGTEIEGGYAWEAYQNERAAKTKERWVNDYATDDRNLFHILHCIEKQKWLRDAKKQLMELGYSFSDNSRETKNAVQTFESRIKWFFKRIPGKSRFRIKSFLKKMGFHFSTDY